ncbi:hypothetical protein PINS_up000598 [Pythium insidiosum]|nr:hypothetical protein PINS_up000598 [Pythium insidiosum]
MSLFERKWMEIGHPVGSRIGHWAFASKVSHSRRQSRLSLRAMADGDLWRDRNKVFVAGIPSHVDDDALYAHFRPIGEMFQAKVVYDNRTGRSKGFGFLTFCEYVHALDAVSQMNQSVRPSRRLFALLHLYDRRRHRLTD